MPDGPSAELSTEKGAETETGTIGIQKFGRGAGRSLAAKCGRKAFQAG